MCSISVDPIPSRISRLYRAYHLCQRSAGSGSAADTHTRTADQSWSCVSACSIALYSVGTENTIVGRCSAIAAKTASGVGLPLKSTVDAPAQYGSDKLLPNP